jgi:hypothetical protein
MKSILCAMALLLLLGSLADLPPKKPKNIFDPTAPREEFAGL